MLEDLDALRVVHHASGAICRIVEKLPNADDRCTREVVRGVRTSVASKREWLERYLEARCSVEYVAIQRRGSSINAPFPRLARRAYCRVRRIRGHGDAPLHVNARRRSSFRRHGNVRERVECHGR